MTTCCPEGSPEYYEEFIRIYPHDPLCDRIRLLLGNLLVTTAWHKTVLANSPVIYKSFYDNYGNSPYAKSALKLQVQPKAVPLMQFTHLAKSPAFKPASIGISPKLGISKDNLGTQASLPTPSKIVTLPAKGTTSINPANGSSNNGTIGKVTTLPGKTETNPTTGAGNNGTTGKVTTLPGKINTIPDKNNGSTGKVTTLPGRINANPIRVQNRPTVKLAPRNYGGSFGGGNSSPRLATQSRSSFGGGRFGGGGFRH